MSVTDAVRKSIRRSTVARSSFRGSSLVNTEMLRDEDSEKISYIGLKSYIRQNHPATEDGKSYSIFTDIGSLPPLISIGGDDIELEIPYVSKQLGLGASLLLLVTKTLTWLFFILTLANVPVMAIFYH